MDLLKTNLAAENTSTTPKAVFFYPRHEITLQQLALFLIWVVCGAVWLIRRCRGKRDTQTTPTLKDGLIKAKQAEDEGEEGQPADHKTAVEDTLTKLENGTEICGETNKSNSVKVDMVVVSSTQPNNGQFPNGGKLKSNDKTFTSVKPPCSFDDFLKYVMVFGAIMMYFYLCDYRKVFPATERVYVRDTFLFLVFLLFLVASAFTVTPTADKLINRDQTEEWKGWMQVMFVWYHYFAAKEWYNWIRVYIAAYVWMTGFGNFSFFWVRKDFSLWRMLKMLFRLNFLVIVMCAVTDNEYMNYYICAMHTYWFLTVYIFMRTFNSWNQNRFLMLIKFAAYALANAIIFDVPGVCEKVFYPAWIILKFHNGNYPLMHEWAFRGGLDHWATFVGMLCAYNYPHYENLMNWLDEKASYKGERLTSLGIKLCMAGVAVVIGIIWYEEVMTKDKHEYNALHPYTSWTPILIFIVLRNLFPVARTHYLNLFAFLGKITLETYLSQLHVYLQSNAKELIGYIPGYPLLNLAFSTVIYLIISYVLFHLTVEFSCYLLPRDMQRFGRNVMLIAVILTISMIGAFTIKTIFHI
ncbi:protein REDUCED WALL ACETYLATION 2 [Lingula anatina]|uniref:Protein REDUCED WALL ACETYLATION 2 n=1 Tax=Lingula anatina TaxID=7574 RepID=A0A1S3K8L4_LINAN|nr:protein REDUCED WALL ACETYLATION 2 [Lingula anatina]|eukprot:XP_013418784.1 protein REDUCED WALL ACETYLATION 2 [Lingula anatina]